MDVAGQDWWWVWSVYDVAVPVEVTIQRVALGPSACLISQLLTQFCIGSSDRPLRRGGRGRGGEEEDIPAHSLRSSLPSSP